MRVAVVWPESLQRPAKRGRSPPPGLVVIRLRAEAGAPARLEALVEVRCEDVVDAVEFGCRGTTLVGPVLPVGPIPDAFR